MTQGAKPIPEMSGEKFKPVEEQLAYIKKGVAEIIPEPELAAKLEASRKSGKPLRVYLGVDPTAPDLHLGHTVVLRKLKHFQDLGHTAVFLIGDFSAMIGDPTGVSETRPSLTREQVDANAETYLAQVFKILDREKTEVRRNSDWLTKMNAEDVVRLCSHYRLARMLEREDFRSRLDKGQPISVHELLYPLLTARDAVELKSDVELGATEQKFNLLVHREIQREYGLPGQAILTMPILVGTDGERKMSKSFKNYIGITETAEEMFGKLMRIPDDLMWSYIDLLTDLNSATYRREVKEGTWHPFDMKMSMAVRIIEPYHGLAEAENAAEQFRKKFRRDLVPEDMTEVRFQRVSDTQVLVFIKRGQVVETHPPYLIPGSGRQKWSKLLVAFAGVESISAAQRLMEDRSVTLDGEPITDARTELDFNKPSRSALKVGKKKRYYRIVVEPAQP